MATENILMEGVKKGGDRQELHEKIRQHSMEAGRKVKVEGLENDLIERILEDDDFGMSKEEIMALIDPNKFIGRAPGQVEDFIKEVVNPILENNKELFGVNVTINV